MSDETIEIDEPVTVEDWHNVAEGFFLSARGWHRRAKDAEAEVERLTAQADALKTACQRIQADLDGSLGLVIDRAEIQPHLDALDDVGRPGWWL